MTSEEEERKKRMPVQLNLDDLVVLVEATSVFYEKKLNKAKKHKGPVRPKEVTKELAKVQETLQLITLVQNVRTNQINEALRESAGIETANSIGTYVQNETS